VTLILLDTNAVSDIAKNPRGSVAQRALATPPSERVTSVIVAAELSFGLAKKPDATTLARNVHGVLAALEIQALPVKAADHHGDFRAHLERTGQPVDSNDLFIAAHAAVIGATVITRNLKHFTNLPGVKCEDWSQ